MGGKPKENIQTAIGQAVMCATLSSSFNSPDLFITTEHFEADISLNVLSINSILTNGYVKNCSILMPCELCDSLPQITMSWGCSNLVFSA